MAIRNTTLTLAAVGMIAALAVVHDAAAQGTTGKVTPAVTPGSAANPAVSPNAPSVGTKPGTPTPNATAAKFVKCPLAQARTEVVSKLPAGWWQTPYEGPLVATRVEMIGSEKTLVCEYQAYTTRASVMRKVGATENCVAVTEGFNCR